jgi:hypothetical protein
VRAVRVGHTPRRSRETESKTNRTEGVTQLAEAGLLPRAISVRLRAPSRARVRSVNAAHRALTSRSDGASPSGRTGAPMVESDALNVATKVRFLPLRIPLHSITRSGRTRSPFRRTRSRIGAKRRGWSMVGVRLGGGESLLFPHGGSTQRERVGVVHQAVADGVGDRRISECLMPTFGGQLRCDDR